MNTQTDFSPQKPERSYEDLMLFFNAMDEVFFSVDSINRRVIQISNGCEKLYGHKPAEFLANNRLWFELMLPEDRHIVADEDEILERGGKVNKRYRIVRKDGAIRWVENKIIPCLDETGRLTRIDGITWDITSRKEAEERHQQDQEKYRRMVETAQECIWTIDEHNKTNFVNQKMGDILGYAPEEMIGKEPHYFMDEEGKAASIARISRRRQGSKENVDAKYIAKNGQDVWANLSANPIFDEKGNYKGSLAMVTDITQRKLDEEALKKSEANLRTVFDNTDSSYILIDAE
jgi:PAS domain S-box-containing protein